LSCVEGSFAKQMDFATARDPLKRCSHARS
jgi:hypothetical protein